ncbi:MAG: lysine--tRNA ligase [bacterium]|nr:lysine--tRNA ligase [bacterium]
MGEIDIRAERLKKLKKLKDAGMEAYPAESHRDISIADVLAAFEELESGGKKIHIGGRIMSKRGQGGIMFADIFDGTGRLQIVLQKTEVEQALYELFIACVDTGDFIEVSGTVFKTKRGERSLKVQKWRMLSKSLLPIPDEWFGLKDEEKRLRERAVDILQNEELRKMFIRKSKFWSACRSFLEKKDFLEVETPVLETSPGGAEARPFITHHNALDMDVYLRISAGELWQKRLLIAGFPKTFEIGRIFRNEGQSREHLQDYTQMEFYQAYFDYRGGMKLVQELYRHLAHEVYKKYTFIINGHEVDFAEEWKTIDFAESIKEHFGIDPINCSAKEAIDAAREAKVLPTGVEPNKERSIDQLWKQIRKGIAGPAFLVGVPIFLEPLAKRSPQNPNVVERFQVIIAGSEVGKGFSELNDPIDQRKRFEEQQRLRDKGDEEAQRLDLDYVRAMEYGMPPAFGFGVSERLFAFLENKPIHEAQLFPLLRPLPREVY